MAHIRGLDCGPLIGLGNTLGEINLTSPAFYTYFNNSLHNVAWIRGFKPQAAEKCTPTSPRKKLSGKNDLTKEECPHGRTEGVVE